MVLVVAESALALDGVGAGDALLSGEAAGWHKQTSEHYVTVTIKELHKL